MVVADEQLSLAIGKRGQNVRLAARLTGWDIDICTPTEYNKGLDDLMTTLKGVDGIDDVLLDQLLAMGMVSLMDVKEVGPEPLVKELGLEEKTAGVIVKVATEGAERLAAEAESSKVAAALACEHEAEDETLPSTSGEVTTESVVAGDQPREIVEPDAHTAGEGSGGSAAQAPVRVGDAEGQAACSADSTTGDQAPQEIAQGAVGTGPPVEEDLQVE